MCAKVAQKVLARILPAPRWRVARDVLEVRGMNTSSEWIVYDTQTGQVCGYFSTRKAARRKADRLDTEYGAIRFTVRMVNDRGR